VDATDGDTAMASSDRSISDIERDAIRNVQEIVRPKVRLDKTPFADELAHTKSSGGDPRCGLDLASSPQLDGNNTVRKSNQGTHHMTQLKQLLVEELRDLLHAEGQLITALPKMAEAAHHPKLKEAFLHHLEHTEGQVERLKSAFELIGEDPEPKPCKAMMGLVEEGKESIKDGANKQDSIADLGLIAAAQRAEHYEISAYGTARSLARQVGELEIAKLMTQTLGEEESSDFLLTELSKPLMQQASAEENGTKSPARAKKQKA
jgi:ferritin-like metal-binding protein YciE